MRVCPSKPEAKRWTTAPLLVISVCDSCSAYDGQQMAAVLRVRALCLHVGQQRPEATSH